MTPTLLIHISQDNVTGFLVCLVFCLTITVLGSVAVVARVLGVRGKTTAPAASVTPVEKKENDLVDILIDGRQYRVTEDVYRMVFSIYNEREDLQELVMDLHDLCNDNIEDYDSSEVEELISRKSKNINVNDRETLDDEKVIARMRKLLSNFDKDIKKAEDNDQFEQASRLLRVKNVAQEVYNEIVNPK